VLILLPVAGNDVVPLRLEPLSQVGSNEPCRDVVLRGGSEGARAFLISCSIVSLHSFEILCLSRWPRPVSVTRTDCSLLVIRQQTIK